MTRKKGGSDGRAPGGGGYAKSGKPRPGSGGNRKRGLEGKGPTPPANMRHWHAERQATAGRGASGRDTAAGRGATSSDTGSRGAAGRDAKAGKRRGGVATTRSGYSGVNPVGRVGSAPRGTPDGPEMIAGRNPVAESLRAGVPAMALYVTDRAQADERVAEAVRLAGDAGIAVLEAGMSELDRLTGGAVHQGVALRVRPYDYAHPEDLYSSERIAATAPLIVALDGVTDPRNLGAVVRSAAAFGADGVVVPSRRSAGVTAGAWKASAGALSRVPVARAVNLTRALKAFAERGLFVAGLDASGDTDIHELPVADGPLVLVVGSEGRGLSRIVAEACDVLVRIPMVSGTESLNAGMAASIALYEVATVRGGLRR
ncbi:MAG: 23S rRNA (guanosine(2251)-2'-O)-methyltransferase RlmB [Nocardiopsaceae bacterium]|nr:23S rRNA (guanosine(2251)-2'-O)-methyltransferase RlmB [Nocardiopsaceae bacterium]